MEIRLNLATCSLKDAEHAIFIIGAYFGMTALPHVGGANPGPIAAAAGLACDGRPAATPQPLAAHVVIPQVVPVAPTLGAEPQAEGYVSQDADPAATFGANPPALPPGAGEAPDTQDPAQVFAGNGATAPVGAPGSPAAALSAPGVAAPAVGEAGNGAGVVGAQVGSASPATPGPVPSPSAAPAGVELDASGLPWDPRIHSLAEGGGHPKTDKGVWRKKRNVQPLEVSTVEAELRALLAGAPAAVVSVTTPPAATVPPPPPAAVVIPPAPPVAGADPANFADLMKRVTAGVTAGTLPMSALQAATEAYALPNIPALAHRPDLVPSIWTYLRAQYPNLV